MNRKNNVANWIPYLIVMLALISLFSMNMGTATQTLSYNDLQKVVEMYYDCDGDALLVKAELSGPACHTGEYSCFHNPI